MILTVYASKKKTNRKSILVVLMICPLFVCFLYFYANAFRFQTLEYKKHSIKIILIVRNKINMAD